MIDEHIHVLLVEDNPADARLLWEAFRGEKNIRLTHVETLAQAVAKLRETTFNIIMLDLSLPDADGIGTLVTAQQHAPLLPIVVLTGTDDEVLAIRAVREGAQDYLVKGQVDAHLLLRAIRYATERKRVLSALQQREEWFRSLIENALDIITVLDVDGSVRYSSPSFERILGFALSDLAGTNIFELLHPDDAAEFYGNLLADGQTGAAQFECRMRHRNGTWRVFESIGKLEASVSGYVLNSRDITERKRADEELRSANDTLNAVIEASPLSIYAMDLDGNVRSWNKAAQEMFGFPAHQVLYGQLPIVLAEDEAAFRLRLTEAKNGRPMQAVEQRARRRDGSSVEVTLWNAVLRDANGAVDGIVELVADNTERKRLEEQFRQVQKMEAVGRLAGGVAHDFNNLLTVITGYCQMLLEQLGRDHPTAQDLHQVLRAADRATALTRQLLAFSRRQIVKPRVLDPGPLIHDMQPMLQRLLGENVLLTISSSPEASRVCVDPGNLEQVIVNLVVNARDAMPGGGTVAVDVQPVQLPAGQSHKYGSLPAGRYLTISVSDTGTGMTDEVMSHLFEPFFTTKEKGRGTGLGLSTSYGIVKQNHGEILVTSAPGLGSTFALYLPFADEMPERALTAKAPSVSPRGAETILLAEDEDAVRKVVTEMLRQQGYTVLAAVGGTQALEIARRSDKQIDLLITDMMMPGMSGRELGDKLLAEIPGIRILFVSGYTDIGIFPEGEVDRDMAFLYKPFSAEELGRKIREVLEQPSPAAIRFQ